MEHLPLFGEPRREGGRSEAGEPTPEDERERLKALYGEEAGRAPLTKREAIIQNKISKKEIRSRLEELRKKLGIKRSGDQEEIDFGKEK